MAAAAAHETRRRRADGARCLRNNRVGRADVNGAASQRIPAHSVGPTSGAQR